MEASERLPKWANKDETTKNFFLPRSANKFTKNVEKSKVPVSHTLAHRLTFNPCSYQPEVTVAVNAAKRSLF